MGSGLPAVQDKVTVSAELRGPENRFWKNNKEDRFNERQMQSRQALELFPKSYLTCFPCAAVMKVNPELPATTNTQTQTELRKSTQPQGKQKPSCSAKIYLECASILEVSRGPLTICDHLPGTEDVNG